MYEQIVCRYQSSPQIRGISYQRKAVIHVFVDSSLFLVVVVFFFIFNSVLICLMIANL